MVYREKDLMNPPLALIDIRWDVLKADVIANRQRHEANSKCYRDATIDSLMNLFKNKCAVCERSYGTELQVDHYRPRKPRGFEIDPQYNQTGYYWLTYEWSNLTPLCSKCNQNKSNKFPLYGWPNQMFIREHLNNNNIANFAPTNIEWLQGYENPLLINPELEKNPSSHFSFKRDGTLVGRTIQGQETITVYGLNRRDLRRERIEIRDGYITQIRSAFDDFARNNNKAELRGELKGVFKCLIGCCHEDSTFSLFNIFIFKYFDYFIDAKLPANIKGKASMYFKDYLTSIQNVN